MMPIAAGPAASVLPEGRPTARGPRNGGDPTEGGFAQVLSATTAASDADAARAAVDGAVPGGDIAPVEAAAAEAPASSGLPVPIDLPIPADTWSGWLRWVGASGAGDTASDPEAVDDAAVGHSVPLTTDVALHVTGGVSGSVPGSVTLADAGIVAGRHGTDAAPGVPSEPWSAVAATAARAKAVTGPGDPGTGEPLVSGTAAPVQASVVGWRASPADAGDGTRPPVEFAVTDVADTMISPQAAVSAPQTPAAFRNAAMEGEISAPLPVVSPETVLSAPPQSAHRADAVSPARTEQAVGAAVDTPIVVPTAPSLPVDAIGTVLAMDSAGSAETAAAVVDQVVKSLRVQWKQGLGEARIQLRPEHLGPVDISLKVEGGAVTAVVRAESAQVQEWILGHQQSLRQHLEDAGLRLAQLVVSPDAERRHQRDDEEPADRRPRARRSRGGDAEPLFEVVV